MSLRGNKPGIGAYELEAALGQGGFGSVYRGRHVVTGARCALKRLKRKASPSEIASFKAEFALLASTPHPNIVSVHEIFVSNGRWAYTMELVEGLPIHEVPSLSTWPKLRPLFVQALKGLGALHDRGYIHGDVRPENCLLGASLDGASGQLTLVDLGLARPAGQETWVGSPRWAAPELLSGGTGGLQSDLYSLASVFYRLLAGVPPFPQEDVAALIEAKTTAAPPDLLTLAPTCPPEVGDTLTSMLALRPSERPGSVWEVLKRLEDLEGESTGVSRGDTIPPLPLVEREGPLEALLRVCGADGSVLSPQVSLVVGGPGEGRTQLLVSLSHALGAKGCQATMVSGPWAGEHLELAPHLLAPGLWMDRSRLGILARRYPMATAYLGLGEGPRPPQGERREPEESGLTRGGNNQDPIDLMEELVALVVASHGGGQRAILVDDAHGLDDGSLELLRRLAPHLAAKGGGRLGMVLSVEEGALHGRDGLRHLVEGLEDEDSLGERIQLDAISEAGVQALIASSFGVIQGGDGLGEVLHGSSGGNPLILVGLIEELVEGGGLFRPGQGWALDPDIVAERTNRQKGDLGVFFARRLGELGAEERRLLEVAAVLGTDLSREALVALGTGSPTEVAHTLRAIGDAKLLSTASGRLQLNPPRLGEWLVASLPTTRLGTLRGKVGAYLLGSHAALDLGAKARVAEHLLAASSRKGVALAREVAEAWEVALIFEPARRLLRSALGVAERGGVASVPLRRLLARCARRLGDFQEAAQAMEGLAGLFQAVDGDAALRTRREAAHYYFEFGEVLGRSGRWGDGAQALDRGAMLLGADILPEEALTLAQERSLLHRYQGDPKGAEDILLGGLEALGVIDRRGLGEEEGKGRRIPQLREVEGGLPVSLILESCQNLAGATYLQGEPDLCEGWIRAGLTLAGSEFPAGDITKGPTGEATANLLLILCSVLQAKGALDEAALAAEQAIRFFESTGRSQAAARCYNNYAIVRISQGQWQEAIELWERFRRVCDRERAGSDLASVLNNLGAAYREYGRLPQAKKRLERALELARRSGYRHVEGLALGNLGEVALRERRFSEARRFYGEALDIAREVKARDLEVESLRRIVEWREVVGESGLIPRTLDALAEAKALGLPREVGTLLGCLGLALCREGRQGEGLRSFEEGEAILRGADAALELARLKVREAKALFHLEQWDASDRAIGEAEHGFVTLGAQWDLEDLRKVAASIDRNSPVGGSSRKSLQILLDVNSSLSQILDIETLLGEILTQGLKVTAAKRGFIILLDEQGNPTFRAARHMGEEEVDGQSARVSSTVLREVMETQEAKAVTDIEEDLALKNQHSVISLGLGSVMAAPMVRHGKLIGIIYVDSPFAASRIFLSQHLRLFNSLADAAAVAVENATLYEDLRRKTDLMYMMAHEFRTPLTGVLSFAELLMEDPTLSPEQGEFLGIIRDQGRRLSGMVSSVLDLAKMEDNKAEWAMDSLELGAVAREVLRTLSPLAKETSLQVQIIEEGACLPSVFGNVDRLMQVLTNLLSNAFKFTPPGGRIWVRIQEVVRGEPDVAGLRVSNPDGWSQRTWVVGRRLNDSRCIRVSVEDSGRGIDPEALETIFDKFAQEGSRADQNKGTGLGLAIAKEIVEVHGGRIWAENRPEGGAAFRFEIPLSEPDGGEAS